MQDDIDTQSPHRQLFAKVRGLLLSYASIEETRKEKIRTKMNEKAVRYYIEESLRLNEK